jgi:hypothetical protein
MGPRLRGDDEIKSPSLANTPPHSRDAMRPSSATNLPPKKIRGRGERRVPAAPAASCAKVESTRVSTADTPEHPAFPHAMVLTVSFALSPVTGLDCHRRRRNEAPARARLGKGAFRRLDASVGASGPHDFAVRWATSFVCAPFDRSQALSPALPSRSRA